MAYEFGPEEAVDEAVTRVVREQLGAARAWLAVAEAAGEMVDDGDATRDGDGGRAATGGNHGEAPPLAAFLSGDEDAAAAVLGPGAEDVAHVVRGEVDPDATVEDAVHEARKCCKRIRGAVRLVRPAMEDAYDATNTATRDAARELSPIRDAHALLATFDALVAAHADQVPADGIADVRAGLATRAEEATHAVTANLDRVGAARRLLVEAGDGVDDWPLDELDTAALLDAVVGGIARTAARAHDAFVEVLDVPGPPPDDLLHEWRKRVKYSWYHVSLLEPAAPTLLGVLADLHHDLSDALGDDHDLAILSADLREDPDGYGGAEQARAALLLVEGTRRDLQRRAIGVGARLHAEAPDALGTRLVALVEAWWQHGPEPNAGEIEDLHDAADDLGDRTNGQLRELARERDLPGRSGMDRRGLLGALRAAGSVG